MMQQAKRFLRIAGWTLWMAMGVAVSAYWKYTRVNKDLVRMLWRQRALH